MPITTSNAPRSQQQQQDLQKNGKVLQNMGNYVPVIYRVPSVKRAKVNRLSTQFTTAPNNYHFSLFSSDNPSTISGPHRSGVMKFKRSHDFDFRDSVVGVSVKDLNKPDSEEKSVFLFTIPSFLNAFHQRKQLITLMDEMANELVFDWNSHNTPASQVEKREHGDRFLLFDYHQAYPKAPIAYLQMCGNSWQFTNTMNDVDEDVTCDKNDICFQMIYTVNQKPRAGSIYLRFQEWVALLESPSFKQFYDKLWQLHPLNNEYSLKRLDHFKGLTDKTTRAPSPSTSATTTPATERTQPRKAAPSKKKKVARVVNFQEKTKGVKRDVDGKVASLAKQARERKPDPVEEEEDGYDSGDNYYSPDEYLDESEIDHITHHLQ